MADLPTPDFNAPHGVRWSDPYFDPDTCPNCGEAVVEGNDCGSCNEYVPTHDDRAWEAADREFDRLRDEGKM